MSGRILVAWFAGAGMSSLWWSAYMFNGGRNGVLWLFASLTIVPCLIILGTWISDNW